MRNSKCVNPYDCINLNLKNINILKKKIDAGEEVIVSLVLNLHYPFMNKYPDKNI